MSALSRLFWLLVFVIVVIHLTYWLNSIALATFLTSVVTWKLLKYKHNDTIPNSLPYY